jgi:hypothetical protein
MIGVARVRVVAVAGAGYVVTIDGTEPRARY